MESVDANTNLTAEQAAVVSLPLISRSLVTAGPGTGKTHTLIRRIEHLVRAGVPPGTGLLVVSFTRAAVAEVHRRLDDISTDLGAVQPITIDSLSTRLLNLAAAADTELADTFDRRIAQATRLLESHPDLLLGVQHVCIDEIQDLVGVRSTFVMALLGRLDCGFTLLGDPAQGIYEFSVDESGHNPVPSLSQQLRASYELTEIELTVNHRALTADTQRLAKLRSTVDPATYDVSAPRVLRREIESLTAIPSLRFVSRSTQGTVGVLCRHNGRALKISQGLHDAAIPHVLRRPANSRPLPQWLAFATRDLPAGTISRSRFDRTFDPNVGPDAETAWKQLRGLARDRDGISLDLFRTRVAAGWPTDDLVPPQRSDVTVSTIHRAKGLEYDRVVLVDDGLLQRDVSAEESRVIFVALTRARSELFRITVPGDKVRLATNPSASGRWTEHGFDHSRQALELIDGDVDRDAPPGTSYVESDTCRIQKYLATTSLCGEPVTLRYRRRITTDPRIAIYSIEHGQNLIGVTSTQFGLDLYNETNMARRDEPEWPSTIEGVRIDIIETLIGTRAATERSALGSSGMWLAPRLGGFGRYVWKDRTS